jgi:hypothetical protein
MCACRKMLLMSVSLSAVGSAMGVVVEFDGD